MERKHECKTCRLLKGKKIYGRDPEDERDPKKEGIIKLKGDWALNHYGGPEGFLGWLALTPLKHKDELSDLTPEETCALGDHIRNVELTLREYWSASDFEEDPLLKIYVVYFSETKDYHLHFHLIPRTESFSCAFSTKKPAWDTAKLTTCWTEFPKYYRIRSREKAWKGNPKIEEIQKVRGLMAFLKKNLKGAEWLVEPNRR